MNRPRRLGETIRKELWRRWLKGQTYKVISEALQVGLVTVWGHVNRAGGLAPRERRRRRQALSEAEREEISRWLAAGKSVRFIAAQLKRQASTVSREVNRNGGRDCYRAATAEHRAWNRASRPQPCVLVRRAKLRRCVAKKLKLNWSPQQIAAWLRVTFADDPAMRVSHETIYRTLYVQARGGLRKELQQHLRTRRTHRRPRASGPSRTASITDGVSISERPASVEDRAVPGHWEGDLLFGTPTSYIATLVERATRFVMLVRITSKDAKTVAEALKRCIQRMPSQLRKSLTWDRGSELAAHKELSVAADIDIFFCDPRSPWQRGSNENTNGLLRQYFPNGEDISHYTQQQLDRVARQLNERPRETLGWKTPAQALQQLLH